MMNQLTPSYLSTLAPKPVGATSRCNLRNSNSLQTFDARMNQYLQSFLPSSVRAWNCLPNEAKQSNSVNSFKYYLKRDTIQTPKHFYFGSRKSQTLHTTLRTNCSSLNLDLFHKNITGSPLCRCGNVEDSQHFSFHCRFYQLQRTELLNTFTQYLNPSSDVILYCDSSLTLEINIRIFKCVHKYFMDTKRFNMLIDINMRHLYVQVLCRTGIPLFICTTLSTLFFLLYANFPFITIIINLFQRPYGL